MKNVFLLMIHFLSTVACLLRPGGTKAVLAESLLLKHQLLILHRPRKRAPKLGPLDRVLLGLWTVFILPRRMARCAVILKPSTLLRFHHTLVKRKYRLLFSPQKKRKPGPKGPSEELIRAIVEIERRNPRYGCPKIALLISRVFGVEIDKDVVRRVLAKRNPPASGSSRPSWLTYIGHLRDSLWSVDLFRCESIRLKSHWVMVVMDQFTRRIIGFAVQAGDIDGVALCRMFNCAIFGMGVPKYLSSDHDPLFTFHRWQANLRVLDVEEIKTIPYAYPVGSEYPKRWCCRYPDITHRLQPVVCFGANRISITIPYIPISHPFIERLIRTIRREYLDQVLFWSAEDLECKLEDFKTYYNGYRVHYALDGQTPSDLSDEPVLGRGGLDHYQWTTHCRGLFQTPIAA